MRPLQGLNRAVIRVLELTPTACKVGGIADWGRGAGDANPAA